MTDAFTWILAGLAGAALGALFFGGLWWTVRCGMQSNRPALWFLGSVVIRTGITVAGFYWVGADRWQRYAACLLGFLIARRAVTYFTRQTTEDRHASES
ncbi:hypothetical protein JIN85_11460 [Luteolibacter pohnpeiensis]|uniref:ATP synthase subunit I n=1 Tax=Luteolibacter pohnpeiensis TaxID=454153 RepID=A0A934S8Y9_9BACT|nr:ATP synthase subunit I [Luteolibacter pohnpeiensis]MBK1883036.1 hypothetical protein [Luteolibacter pohnpeiensis]